MQQAFVLSHNQTLKLNYLLIKNKVLNWRRLDAKITSYHFSQMKAWSKFDVINPPSIHFIFTKNKEQESLMHNKWPSESNKKYNISTLYGDIVKCISLKKIKKNHWKEAFFRKLVAGVGFEPTTFRLWAWRATKLLYPAIRKRKICQNINNYNDYSW